MHLPNSSLDLKRKQESAWLLKYSKLTFSGVPLYLVMELISVEPKEYFVDVGITVVFFCKYEREAEWTFSRWGPLCLGVLPQNAYPHNTPGTNEIVLIIRHVNVNNVGVYSCHTEENGLIDTDYGELHVKPTLINGNSIHELIFRKKPV